MPRFRRVVPGVVIDSSCLRCLLHLNLLLKLVLRYNAVYIPRHVWQEVSRAGRTRYQLRRLLKIYTFLKKYSVINEIDARIPYDRNLNPLAPVDRGEAEVVVQARELGISEVLIDDAAGRKIAQKHSLNVKGVLGLLKGFRQNGIIGEVRPLMEKLRKDISFRIDAKFLKRESEAIGEE